MSNELYEVRESKIHNKGVYSATDIPKGTKILEYTGEKINKEESDRRYDHCLELSRQDHKKAATYLFELDDEYCLDGDIPNNDAKYINHSCNPNCIIEIEDERIWIYAKRDIKKGEELTFSYEFDVDEGYPDHVCKCGTENCVGYIVAEEDRPILKEYIEKKHKKED